MKSPTAIFMNLLVLIALAFPVFAQHEEGSQPIALKTSTGTLFGTLELPQSRSRVRVVLIIAGRADRPRRKLARA
ncbi:MAG: hypothetical protein H0V90_02825 [Blastocatellia bacterium]|nr:hypothetical protein [Blastocatellia bacterium]